LKCGDTRFESVWLFKFEQTGKYLSELQSTAIFNHLFSDLWNLKTVALGNKREEPADLLSVVDSAIVMSNASRTKLGRTSYAAEQA